MTTDLGHLRAQALPSPPLPAGAGAPDTRAHACTKGAPHSCSQAPPSPSTQGWGQAGVRPATRRADRATRPRWEPAASWMQGQTQGDVQGGVLGGGQEAGGRCT